MLLQDTMQKATKQSREYDKIYDKSQCSTVEQTMPCGQCQWKMPVTI